MLVLVIVQVIFGIKIVETICYMLYARRKVLKIFSSCSAIKCSKSNVVNEAKMKFLLSRKRHFW